MTGWQAEVERALRLAGGRPPRCGQTRLICVDGPSGAGKTVLATRLAERTGAQVVRMDSIYPGWDGLEDAVDTLVSDVLTPLAAGVDGGYRRYDWTRHRYAERHPVPVAAWLVVEGVGCAARAPAGYACCVVFVNANHDVRYRRAMARDGEGYRPHWQRWKAQEDAHFAREQTASRADLVLDTSSWRRSPSG